MTQMCKGISKAEKNMVFGGAHITQREAMGVAMDKAYKSATQFGGTK